MRLRYLALSACLIACSDSDGAEPEDGLDAAQQSDASAQTDAGSVDAAPFDASAQDAASLDAEPDAADPCSLGTGEAALDVTAIRAATPAGAAPKKGEPLQLTLTVQNGAAHGVMVELTALLDSKRFGDYSGVPLASKTQRLCPGENSVTLSAGPFLSNAANKKEYALGSGGYEVARVTLKPEGQSAQDDDSYDGKAFSIATSNALLVPVVYDAGYFSRITKNPSTTPEAYLNVSFTRKNDLFTPSGSDPDGQGTFQGFAGGFDEMMNVRHLFRLFPGFPGESTTSEGWCEDAAAYGQQMLGMATKWGSQRAETRPERHGFDYLIGLHPGMGGGVACGWLDVQVSGLINTDVDRQQVILVHESGHIFGAPHCDEVGNGSGGTLQGYVMCSGEKHERYPESFVWHATSRRAMSSHWN